MDNKPHLISDAGRRYQKLNNTRPLNTRQRLRMYHSIEVQPCLKRLVQKRPTMQTIDRSKIDSFLLRHNKQINTSSNYHINQSLVHQSSPGQKFAKAQFTRIIGDVRDQDYSLPLLDDCDKRCNQAFITLPHQSTIVTTHDTHKARMQHHNINFTKQISRQSLSQSMNMKKINSLVSTQQSQLDPLNLEPIKKRVKRIKNMQLHDALKKIRLFDHDIGHKYGQKLFTPKNTPEYYDIQKSNQNLIKKSMSVAKGHVRFSSFRQKIATRYDRADPHWGMTINYEDTHQNPEWKQAKTLNMQKISERRLNEVFSKYPIRQSMQLVTPTNVSSPRNNQ